MLQERQPVCDELLHSLRCIRKLLLYIVYTLKKCPKCKNTSPKVVEASFRSFDWSWLEKLVQSAISPMLPKTLRDSDSVRTVVSRIDDLRKPPHCTILQRRYVRLYHRGERRDIRALSVKNLFHYQLPLSRDGLESAGVGG